MKFLSPAKINLTLDVVSKKTEKGYHKIQTIFQQIPLFDELKITRGTKNTGLCFECDQQEIQENPENTIQKAYTALSKHCGRKWDVNVKLTKNIPIGSGLGGGSSNAASFLLGMNEMFAIGLNKEELMALGEKVGMDVPFFLSGTKTAFGNHFGEKIVELRELSGFFVFLCMGDIHISTKEAYKKSEKYAIGKKTHETLELRECIKKKESVLQNIEKYLHNDFEEAILQEYEEVYETAKILKKETSAFSRDIYFHLTGSGSCFFSLFPNEEYDQWKKMEEKIRKKYSFWTSIVKV